MFLNPAFLDPVRFHLAPCTCVQVYINSDLSFSAINFVLTYITYVIVHMCACSILKILRYDLLLYLNE